MSQPVFGQSQQQPLYGQPNPMAQQQVPIYATTNPQEMQAPQQQIMDRYNILDQGFKTSMAVHQKIPSCCTQIMAALTCSDDNMKFNIVDQGRGNQVIHFAEEKSSCCQKVIFGPNRAYDMTVYDGQTAESNPMLVFSKGVSYCGKGNNCIQICCCQPEMKINTPNEEKYLGKVKIPFWVCSPSINIYDELDNLEAQAESSCFYMKCCCGNTFDVFPVQDGKKSSQKVGQVKKVYGGILKEAFTDSDTFEISYYEGTNAKGKARLMATVFLINSMFFESDRRNK